MLLAELKCIIISTRNDSSSRVKQTHYFSFQFFSSKADLNDCEHRLKSLSQFFPHTGMLR